MFLRKKANEIEMLLKQAAAEKEEKDNYTDILDLIEAGSYDEAVEKAKELGRYNTEELNLRVIEKFGPEIGARFSSMLGEAKNTTTDTQETKEEERVEPKEEADEFMAEASLFDYLTKKAEDLSFDKETEQVEEEKHGLSQDLKDAIAFKAQVESMYTSNIDEIVDTIVKEFGDTEEVRGYAKECASKEVDQSKTETIDNKTRAIGALLDSSKNAKEVVSKEELDLDLSKSASTAEEWLKKVANTIDEKSDSPEHKGKEMFNSDVVTFGGADTPKHPGQKVLMEREGGNPEVKTVYNVTEKPEVDVYKDKKTREKVVSISDGNATIAFMQPIPLGEPERIDIGFNYNGIVTGSNVNNGKTNVDETLASPAHETNNYLDKVDELSKKDPEKIAGEIKETKKAFFEVNFKKTAAQEEHIGKDIVNDVVTEDPAKGTMLSTEQLESARKDIQEKEDQIKASASVNDPVYNDIKQRMLLIKTSNPQEYTALANIVSDPYAFKAKAEALLTSSSAPGQNQVMDMSIDDYKHLAEELFGADKQKDNEQQQDEQNQEEQQERAINE